METNRIAWICKKLNGTIKPVTFWRAKVPCTNGEKAWIRADVGEDEDTQTLVFKSVPFNAIDLEKVTFNILPSHVASFMVLGAVQTIKDLRATYKGLGLKEAKEATDWIRAWVASFDNQGSCVSCGADEGESHKAGCESRSFEIGKSIARKQEA